MMKYVAAVAIAASVVLTGCEEAVKPSGAEIEGDVVTLWKGSQHTSSRGPVFQTHSYSYNLNTGFKFYMIFADTPYTAMIPAASLTAAGRTYVLIGSDNYSVRIGYVQSPTRTGFRIYDSNGQNATIKLILGFR